MTYEGEKALKEVEVAVNKWRKERAGLHEPYSDDVIFKIVRAARLTKPYAVTKVTGVPGYRIRQMLEDPHNAEVVSRKKETLSANKAVAPSTKEVAELHQSKIDSVVTFTQIVPVVEAKNMAMDAMPLQERGCGGPICEFEISKTGDVIIRAFVAIPEVLELTKDTLLAVRKAGG